MVPGDNECEGSAYRICAQNQLDRCTNLVSTSVLRAAGKPIKPVDKLRNQAQRVGPKSAQGRVNKRSTERRPGIGFVQQD